MKTEVVVSRPFLHFRVRQMSKTEFLNCNDALKAVNERRFTKGLSEKRMDRFFLADHSEYLEALCKYLNSKDILITPNSRELEPSDLIKKKKGKYGGTWLHPYYFAKFARWLSPEFEAMVDIWVSDNLLCLRNDGGDAFTETNTLLNAKFNMKGWEFAKVSRFVARKVFGTEDKDQWNSATPDQLKKREKLLAEIAGAVKYGSFRSLDHLVESMEAT